MATDATKEEIRERVDIVDLVSRYVSLRQAGRNFKGLCPFHQERTPSFNVNRELKLWKCFGCGAGGDVFSFLMAVENLSFSDAGRRLAEMAGLEWESTPVQRQQASERDRICQANALALQWFRSNLSSLPAAEAARAHLAQRGILPETVDQFRIGYAPEAWDALTGYLARHGIGQHMAVAAGLARETETGRVYDVFRHRLIFPITDVAGKPIGFGGRALSTDEPAKYLNTPETPAFHKGRTFYGLDLARRHIAETGTAIVVEGYTDVIGLVQAGIANVVAGLGTALTEQHVRVLGRYAQEIVLCYDADAAGMQAALRSVPLFEACPAEVTVLVLPAGRDPDEYVREVGAEGFRELLGERLGLVQYRLLMIFRQQAEAGPEGVARAAREAAGVLQEVTDLTRRARYVAQVAEAAAEGAPHRAAALERALADELARRARGTGKGEQRSWDDALRAQGVPRGARRERGDGLDWRRRQRRERQAIQERVALCTDARCAERAQLAPDSEHSPLAREFIAQALSRSGGPCPPGLLKRERRLVRSILRDPRLAGRALALLQPDDLLVPIHQEIVRALADGLAEEPGPEGRSPMMGLLEPESEAYATAVELMVEEEPTDDEVAVEEDVLVLREARVACGLPRTYNPYATAGDQGPPAEPPPREVTLRELEKVVEEGLRGGTLAADDPLYQRYIALRRQLHGRGNLGFAETEDEHEGN